VKLLLDACVWGKAREELAAVGHEVIHAGDWTEDPGDEEILARAYREGRVLITLDKDFGELVIVRAQRHVGIIRLVGIPARRQGAVCAAVLERYEAVLPTGAIVTAEPARVRVRSPSPDVDTQR
jgi:predicted nuclease of predicted toxin-antitoxin system